MNWTILGGIFIACAAVLVFISEIMQIGKKYPVRRDPGLDNLHKAQMAAVARGQPRKLLLGDRLSPVVFPGLGLQALSALPSFLDRESGVDGGLTLGSADGGLIVFARQIVRHAYSEGFSPALHQAGARTKLYGPTPLSFTAGILPELNARPGSSLALFGYYGPEALLWVDAVQRNESGAVFASGGTLTAQAAMFLSVRDLLIG